MAVTEIIQGKKYVIQKGTDTHGFPVGTVVNIKIGATKKESFAVAEDDKGNTGFIIKNDVDLAKNQ